MTAALKLSDDAYCFVCGDENLHGLQLNWRSLGDETQTEFYPQRHHQGWRGIVHGGILAALLDEAMTRLVWERHGVAVTAELTVRYSNTARIGEKLTVRGRLGPARGRMIEATADIRNASGRVIASATGKAVRPRTLSA